MTLPILLGLGIAALAWRLNQAPVELPWVARQVEALANAGEGPTRLSIGHASIAWAGWETGHLSPFRVVLRDIRATDPSGAVRAELPDAAVALAAGAALRGEVLPAVVELRRPTLRLFRAEDGSVAVDLGSLTEEGAAEPAPPPAGAAAGLEALLRQLLAPPSEDGPFAALRRVDIEGGRIVVVDRQLGRSWILDEPEIELRRGEQGGLEGGGRATLRLGEEAVPVRLEGRLAEGPERLRLALTLPSIHPGALARAAAPLAPLGALDAPAALTARVALDAANRVTGFGIELRAGAGALDLARGRRIPIASLDLALAGDAAAVALQRGLLRLADAPGGGRGPAIAATGRAVLGEGRWRAEAEATLDEAPFADLATWWPAGLGTGERAWILENITAGTARHGRVTLRAEAGEALEGVDVTALEGRIEAEGATVHWLRPVPPVEGATGSAEIGLSEVVVRTRAARQAGTGLRVGEGTIRFTGLDGGRGSEQAELRLPVAGPVADVLATIRHPRLKLFERRRVALPPVTGTVEAVLQVGFPLLDDLDLDDLRIRAEGRASGVRVPRAVLGRDLDRGQLDIAVDTQSLRIAGTAQIAQLPARLGVEMDFRPGNPQQLVSTETLSARFEARSLASFGLDPGTLLGGAIGLEARNETRRNGQSRLVLRADLREAEARLSPLGWRKPRGLAGSVEATLRMTGDRVEAVEQLRAEAGDLLLRARAPAFREGWPERVEIQEAAIGATRLAGEVRPPGRGSGPWQASLRGPALDLRAALAPPETPERDPPAGEARPPLSLEARFERVLLGERREFRGVVARLASDAQGVLREARATGRTTERGGFDFAVTPDGPRRRLRLTSDDAGGFLRGIDLLRSIDGGRLAVNGVWAETRPGAPLTGTAEMDEFSLHGAPAMGKLLQAMSLFGLVEAVQGPGLLFARLVAPFTLTPGALVLNDARAFSASLGLTAKGRIDRRHDSIDMEGTIVPAYALNSALGHLPLIGRIFSAEVGGGFISTAFHLRGPLNDPQVMVNPLSNLTPGFLRGLFGAAGQAPAAAPAQGAN